MLSRSKYIAFPIFPTAGAPQRHRLLIDVLILFFYIKIKIGNTSIRELREMLRRLYGSFAEARQYGSSADQIIWAIRVVSRYLPGHHTCLVRALAAQVILEKNGFPCRLYISIANTDGKIRGHAWIESDDEVIIGKDGFPELVRIEI